MYVNNEIEEFIRQGREDSIIPFIVDGEVNAKNPDNECFPLALRELKKELRGIDMRTNGKTQAVIDTVATMLSIRRDELWNRYKIRQLRQRIAMAAVACLAILCAIFNWDYKRPRYEYYADYVDCNGIPQGIISLDENQYSKRNGFYQFEYRRIPFGEPGTYNWRLKRVSYVNSALTPQKPLTTEHNERYPIQQLAYSPQNGEIINITYYNEKKQAADKA